MSTDTFAGRLRRLSRTGGRFEPLLLQVSGRWGDLLVQLVYSRHDPIRPGDHATFVAARHRDLGTLSYEVVGEGGLLSLQEWRDGVVHRAGIWWSTGRSGDTPAETRSRREAMLWQEIPAVLAAVETLTDAQALAEHLAVAIRVEVGPRPAGAAGPTAIAMERAAVRDLDRLEELLTVDAALPPAVADLSAEVVVGDSPAAQENRTVRHARATLALDGAAAARVELDEVVARVRVAVAATREARRRARGQRSRRRN